LNHRFYNFTNNHGEKWHHVELSEKFDPVNNYYYTSFVYRILEVLSWTRKIESELIYLDSTIATKEDLIFIKYLRLFSFIFCDLDSIAKDFEVDKFYSKDHFFRNNFDEMSEAILKDGALITYENFTSNFKNYEARIKVLCDFINGVCDDENRLRWDRLQLFHYAIIGFLNKFGYDYQKWNKEKIKEVFERIRKNKFLENFKSLVERLRLENEKQINRVIKYAR
jgi:hypothetical protein